MPDGHWRESLWWDASHREQLSRKGKSQKLPSGKKACGKSKSQSFPIKISLTLGIIEHSVSCCPEIRKGMANYQIQMEVSKQLAFSKTFAIIYMPFLHARAKHLLKRFHWRSRVHTIYLLLIQTSVHLLVVAGPQWFSNHFRLGNAPDNDSYLKEPHNFYALTRKQIPPSAQNENKTFHSRATSIFFAVISLLTGPWETSLYNIAFCCHSITSHSKPGGKHKMIKYCLKFVAFARYPKLFCHRLPLSSAGQLVSSLCQV